MIIGETIVGRAAPIGAFSASKGFLGAVFKVDASADQNWTAAQLHLPPVLSSGLDGLVDTASEISRVDEALVEKWGLQPVGEIPSSYVGLQRPAKTYKIQINLPPSNFIIGGLLSAVPLRSSGIYADLLIGLDVLFYFSLHLFPAEGRASLIYTGRR